ncbi:MAG: GntR family transcriptional regulator [Thiothrix sp.]|nr:GntR family transcriptional regulator [Thiothrix sp.]HPQ94498.1 GntR family transcriptional regulator [Thiolinea sp.]
MKKENLYNDLKRRILTLALEPGSSLDEVQLSEEYRISRTPLRDVFRQLAGEGYIDIVSNRGAFVAAMNYKTLRSFFMTAPMLYAAIGRLAAENAQPHQLEMLRAAQHEFRAAMIKEDAGGMVFWNDRFHGLMGEMAENPYLRPSYERLLIDHARISQTFYRPRQNQDRDNLELALSHHDAMIVALEAGDPEGMVELIRAHWALSRSNMEKYVYPDPLPLEGE